MVVGGWGSESDRRREAALASPAIKWRKAFCENLLQCHHITILTRAEHPSLDPGQVKNLPSFNGYFMKERRTLGNH